MVTQSLSCPVCGHPDVQESKCSNCGTDLSVYRMLAELPSQEANAVETQKLPWRWITVALGLILVVGITSPVLWAYGRELLISQLNSRVAEQQQEITGKLSRISQQQQELSEMLEEVAREQNLISTLQGDFEGCGGFYYTIERGDTLTGIARRFYGDTGSLELITSKNPQLEGQLNELEIGEVIFIPNEESNCP
ncbi:LysM peptidoglycan-binding domain-containing protein [Euhalothece natronophila Z-M001]|uniref:LysM peptidoglycan-binding domain-containing protein n=1 Tax=Euhalothece natronophila Z-M001 TaxID=522448 RepID=A0A5B8NLW4_9CHRO|nr:LysM domain-containing protein [Euhalothece natronophila]QDZ40262.1 LysM peptidoglycan-binding domain-containing protein [Euhalothece natronophila Z-M001]